MINFNIFTALAPYNLTISIVLLLLLLIDVFVYDGRLHNVRTNKQFGIFAAFYAMPFVNLFIGLGVLSHIITRYVIAYYKKQD